MHNLLLLSAAIGFVHTIIGPDHYLPLVALSKTHNWSSKKTSLITAICALGHILTSLIIVGVFLMLNVPFKQMAVLESIMGEVVAWGFITVGIVLLIRSTKHYIQRKQPCQVACNSPIGNGKYEYVEWQ